MYGDDFPVFLWPTSESGKVSGGVAALANMESSDRNREYTQKSEMETPADRIDYPVRKLAHMTEYGIPLSAGVRCCTQIFQ